MKKSEMNKLDKLWSIQVKLLAGEKCEYCGKGKRKVMLHSHHIFGRRARSTRWSLSNGICLCALHHKFSNEFSAHETPTLFTEWIIQKRGKDWYDKLRLLHNNLDVSKTQEYDFILQTLI